MYKYYIKFNNNIILLLFFVTDGKKNRLLRLKIIITTNI